MTVRAPTREVRSWTTDSRRWATYRPRANDIVIATPPKCGTTWMQQIVSLLVFQTPEARSLQTLSPWIEHRAAPVEAVMADIEAQSHRRFVKSHLPFDAMPVFDDMRYIHVVRDGRDAFMSWHNHSSHYSPLSVAMMNQIGEQDETIGRPLPRPAEDPHVYFQAWMTEGPQARLADDYPAAQFFEIARSYWRERRRANLLLVHYNDLKADLDAEMHRIAAFLDIAIPAATWHALVEAASFEFMKKNGGALMPRAAMAWDNGHERFLFKGTNARWREALSTDDIARYDERVGRELSPHLARWLEQGRRGAGDPRATAD